MPRRADGTPKYRRQVKANGKALGFAEFREPGCAAPVRIYFRGEFKSKESRDEYNRLIAKWETNGRRLPVSVLGVSPDTCKTKTCEGRLKSAAGGGRSCGTRKASEG